ncbi:MAG: SARP family transcriptional regulator, partial [Anaerolineae bacterium]|nr:SARP family transcriptional regulator [Anaerolineae bacterium]
MTVGLRLTLLGKPQVTEYDAPITGFISAKAEALLYYLAVTREAHSRDVLASLLWGEMTQTAARKNLTKVLSNLRRLVGGYFVIDHHAAAFKQDSLHWLDVRVFEEALESGEVEGLQKAVELYRGDFLESFYVKDAPAFEDWLRSEQARLRELMLQTLEALANQLAASGDYVAAIKFVQQLLDFDAYREAAHRQLMILLARIGRHGAALAQYKICCRILAEELGLEPATETQALYKRIKTAGVARPHNLPHLTTTFVGRAVELSKITVLLNDPACRLLTIAGPGG